MCGVIASFPPIRGGNGCSVSGVVFLVEQGICQVESQKIMAMDCNRKNDSHGKTTFFGNNK